MPYYIVTVLKSDEPVISDMRILSNMETARYTQLTFATEYGPDHYIPIYYVDTTEESAGWKPDEIFNYFEAEIFGPCEKLDVRSIDLIWGSNKKPEREKLKEASIAKITSLMQELKSEGLDPVDVIHLAIEEYQSGIADKTVFVR